jgi:hypothetical protein
MIKLMLRGTKIALTPQPLSQRGEGEQDLEILVPLSLWERG